MLHRIRSKRTKMLKWPNSHPIIKMSHFSSFILVYKIVIHIKGVMWPLFSSIQVKPYFDTHNIQNEFTHGRRVIVTQFEPYDCPRQLARGWFNNRFIKIALHVVILYRGGWYSGTLWLGFWVHLGETILSTLQWRHNESDGVSNHRRLHCLFNFWIENIKAPRHWPLWGGFTGDRWIIIGR